MNHQERKAFEAQLMQYTHRAMDEYARILTEISGGFCNFNQNQFIMRFWIFCLLLYLPTHLVGQESAEEGDPTISAAYLEIGGNGGGYSFNYDRIFYSKGNSLLAYRIGLSFFPGNAQQGNKIGVLVPIELNYLNGRSPWKMEVGLGYSPNTIYNRTSKGNLEFGVDHLLFARFGYRYQKPTKGFLFRIAFTPAQWPNGSLSRFHTNVVGRSIRLPYLFLQLEYYQEWCSTTRNC